MAFSLNYGWFFNAASGGVTVLPGQGTLVVTGLAPIVFRQDYVVPTQGTITVAGLAPTMVLGIIAQPAQGTIVATGSAPTLVQGTVTQPAQGTITVAGLAPTASKTETVQPAQGSVVVSGLDPIAQVNFLQSLRPTSDIAADGWLPSSGSDLFDMLDEPNVNFGDFIYSPDNPTTQKFEVTLAELWPAGTSGHGVQMGLEAAGQDTDFDFDLVEGATVRDSWTESVTLAQGQVVRDHPFSAGVIAAITNGANLRVRGVARAP